MRVQYAYLLLRSWRTILIGSRRSESFEITTATSNLSIWASCNKCVARFTSRPFFLGLDDPRIFLRLSRRHDQRHGDLVRQEVTKMNGDLGERPQRPQVKLLPDGLVQVTRAGGYQSREILDLCYGVFRQQKLAKCFRIQPAIRGIAKRPIVKIEAIYVDVCVQKSLLKMQKPPARRLRARPPKRPRGYQN